MKTNIVIARAAPLIAIASFPLATIADGVRNLCDLVNMIMYYFNVAIYMIIGLATVVFVWNVYNYFLKADADRKEAGTYVMYSVIGFFVILSFWGLVNIVKETLDLEDDAPSSFSRSTTGGCSASNNSNININPNTINNSPTVNSPMNPSIPNTV